MKTMVVTGAAQGLGLATASLPARRGYRVMGAQAAGLSGDVTSEPFVQHLAEWIARDYGAADGLVNNAGISLIAPAEETTAAHQTLAAEWGGRGVRVNAVCPGWIKTEMDVADQGSGAYSDADIVNRVPMARFARAEDVAEAIAFLADSDRNGFINGVSLPVDGGWIADASWDSLRLRTRS